MRASSAYRLVLSLLLVLALSLPSSFAVAASGGTLLCTPSGQPVSAKMQAAVAQTEAVLRAASGQPDETEGLPHCEDCLQPVASVLPSALPLPKLATRQVSVFVATETAALSFVRGPPLGSRAPPLSV